MSLSVRNGRELLLLKVALAKVSGLLHTQTYFTVEEVERFQNRVNDALNEIPSGLNPDLVEFVETFHELEKRVFRAVQEARIGKITDKPKPNILILFTNPYTAGSAVGRVASCILSGETQYDRVSFQPGYIALKGGGFINFTVKPSSGVAAGLTGRPWTLILIMKE